ncbi:ABC transporter ATP-binding protein [Actinopolymorpha sp. B17G11]|uniref:ABC transporter ATP-binding protein n=1 Tax=Actinopolymorpha sp. B17G11 TaxID=3160861 RepID=UPI0032E423FE
MRDRWRGFVLLVRTAFRAGRWLSVGALLEPLGQVANAFLALLIGLLVDAVVDKDAAQAVVALTAIVVSQAMFQGLTSVGNELRLVLSERVGFAFDREIARLTAALPGLDHHERADYQDRLELLRQNQGVLGASMNSLVNAANAFVVGVSSLVVLLYLHPLLLVLVLFVLPGLPLAVWNQRWQRTAEERSATPSRLARHLRRLSYDRNAGMEIRVFGLQDEIARRVRDTWVSARGPVLRAARRWGLAVSFRDLVFAVGFGAALLFMVWRATRGEASLGEVAATIVLCQQLQTYVMWPINMSARFGATLRAAGRLLWLQDFAESHEARRAGAEPAPERLTAGIVFEDVWFRYPGTEAWVLRNVSLTLPAGSVVAVVGENGAGKTTLVKLLTRMYEPTRGRILVDGADLATLDVRKWRARLSAAFQDFARFELVAREAVGLGDLAHRDDDAAVTSALSRAGAADVVPTLPGGIDTQLGSSWADGVDLSTGQWQKLALGRALMRTDPLVVFFDEPTASLDAPTEHALFESYATTARAGAANGMITVLVSHRFSTVRTADLILVIQDASVSEAGSHDELIDAGGLYADLYTLQASSYR